MPTESFEIADSQDAAYNGGAGGAIRGSLYWTGGNTSWAYEGELTPGPWSSLVGVKLYILRAASAVITTQGQHIATSAWIGIPPTTTGDAGIVGKVWDAFILSQSATLDDDVFHRDLKFRCIARNGAFGASSASLWVAYE